MRGGRTREGRNNTDFREVIRDHLRSGPSSLRRIAAAMVRAGYDFAHPRNAASEYLRSMPDVIKLRWGVYGLRTEAVDNADLEESPHQGIDQIAPPGEVDQPGAPPDMLSGGDAPSEVKADVEEVRDSIRRHAVSLLKMRGSMRINQLAEAIVETGIGLDAKRIEEIIRGLPGFRIARRGS